jgi:protochlorophyllide reductase
MSTWTAGDVPDQNGRIAVVTGANAGLGYEIAKVLAARGATVVMACRNLAKAEAAAGRLRDALPGAVLEVRPLDLADLASVRAFAERFATEHDRLDLLINNAGLMAIDEARTADGFEMQFGVNHLGHYALTAHLLPLAERTPGARVATMSSMGHRAGRMRFDDLMPQGRDYDRWRAYFQSKLANLLFSAELHRRLEAAGSSTIAVAAHPGGADTDLGTEGSGTTNAVIRRTSRYFGQSPVDGALPMLRAVTDPSVRGGQYYGPRLITFGGAVLETPSRRARDAESARRLWTVSAQLTGVEPLVPV